MNGLNSRRHCLSPLFRKDALSSPVSSAVDDWEREPIIVDSKAELGIWQDQSVESHMDMRLGYSGCFPVPFTSHGVATAVPKTLVAGPPLSAIPRHIAHAVSPFCFQLRRSGRVSLADEALESKISGADIELQRPHSERLLDNTFTLGHGSHRSEGGGTQQRLLRQHHKLQPHGSVPWNVQQSPLGSDAGCAPLVQITVSARTSSLDPFPPAAAAAPAAAVTACSVTPGSSRLRVGVEISTQAQNCHLSTADRLSAEPPHNQQLAPQCTEGLGAGGPRWGSWACVTEDPVDLLMADAPVGAAAAPVRRSSPGYVAAPAAPGCGSPGVLTAVVDGCCLPLKQVSLVDLAKGASSPVRAAGSPIAVQRTPTKHTASTCWSPFSSFVEKRSPATSSAAASPRQSSGSRPRDPNVVVGGGPGSLSEQRRLALSSVSNLAQLRDTVAEDAQLPPRDKQGLLHLIDQALEQQQQQPFQQPLQDSERHAAQQAQGQHHPQRQQQARPGHPSAYPATVTRSPPGPSATAAVDWHASAALAAFEELAAYYEPACVDAVPATLAAAHSPPQHHHGRQGCQHHPHQSPQQSAIVPSSDVPRGWPSPYGNAGGPTGPSYPMAPAGTPGGTSGRVVAPRGPAPSDACSQGSTVTGLSDFAPATLATMGSVPESAAALGGGGTADISTAAAGKGWSALRSGAASTRGSTLAALAQQHMAPLDVRKMGLASQEQQQQQQRQPASASAPGAQPASNACQSMHPGCQQQQQEQRQPVFAATGCKEQQQHFGAHFGAQVHANVAHSNMTAKMLQPQGLPCADGISPMLQLPANDSTFNATASHDLLHPCGEPRERPAAASLPTTAWNTMPASGALAAWGAGDGGRVQPPGANPWDSLSCGNGGGDGFVPGGQTALDACTTDAAAAGPFGALPYAASEGGPGEGVPGPVVVAEGQCAGVPAGGSVFAADIAASVGPADEVLRDWLALEEAPEGPEPRLDLDLWLADAGSPNPYA